MTTVGAVTVMTPDEATLTFALSARGAFEHPTSGQHARLRRRATVASRTDPTSAHLLLRVRGVDRCYRKHEGAPRPSCIQILSIKSEENNHVCRP